MMIASQTLLLDFLSIITRVGVIPNHQKYAAEENCGKIKISPAVAGLDLCRPPSSIGKDTVNVTSSLPRNLGSGMAPGEYEKCEKSDRI